MDKHKLEDRLQIATQIIQELYKTVKGLGGDMYILSAIGSYDDTLTDWNVLELIKDWNEGRPSFDEMYEETKK